MKNSKRIVALLLVTIMMFSSAISFAADGDFWKVADETPFATSNEVLFNTDGKGNSVLFAPGDYGYEYNGKVYSMADANAAFALDEDAFPANLAGYTEIFTIPVTPPVDPVDPPVIPEPNTYKIQLTAEDISLEGDGYSNTTIHVELVDSITGQRENINGLQVRLTTTYGQLADQQVVLQNGYAHTTLNSEAVQRAIDVDIDAQVIEGTVPVDYKDNITGMTAKLGLIFTTPGGGDYDDIPRLHKAESNQADRITLYFDRNVNPKNFDHLTNAFVTITQPGVAGNRTVVGFHRLPGNDPHTLEVILAKNDVLIDNKGVSVDLELIRNGHTLKVEDIEFILTDNRKPQVTEIEHNGSMRKLKVYFSEAIESAQFSLDGGTNPINNVTYGTFDSVSQTDERHIVTLDVEYLAPGVHTLQISAPKDFAYATDTENIGTTQELTFEVLDNTAIPTFDVLVESPEQYRIFVKGNYELVGDLNGDNPPSPGTAPAIELQMNDGGVWKEVRVNVLGDPNTYPQMSAGRYKRPLNFAGNKALAWVTNYGNELTVETNTDWTWVFDTDNSEDNYYNHEFRLVVPAGMYRNPANNQFNVETILPLDLELDDESPVMMRTPVERDLNWGEHDILFNEPVKGVGIEQLDTTFNQVGETPSQLQDESSTALPNIVVEYRGKDSNGVTVTKYGYAEQYVSTNGKDTEIRVRSNDNLRGFVDNECYEEDWVMIVRNVTDDIGNAAITITKPFTIKATPAPDREFKIATAELMTTTGGISVNLPTNVTDLSLYDIVKVSYTDFIRLTGNDDSAINKSNYKLNGRDLGNDSFVLVDLDSKWEGNVDCLCRYEVDGYNAVYIFTPTGSIIDTAGQFSNTLEVNQRLYSKNFGWANGVKLLDEYQVELDYSIKWNGFGECVRNIPYEEDNDEEPEPPVEEVTLNVTFEAGLGAMGNYTVSDVDNAPEATQYSISYIDGDGDPQETEKFDIGTQTTTYFKNDTVTVNLYDADGNLVATVEDVPVN